jgi:hypothetical protein
MNTTSPAQRNGLEHNHALVTVIAGPNALESRGTRALFVTGKDTDRDIESRRILDRMAREADSSAMPLASRTAKRTRDHLTAADADPTDRIEYWGTRIGRAIGLVVTIGLIVWLVIFVVRG